MTIPCDHLAKKALGRGRVREGDPAVDEAVERLAADKAVSPRVADLIVGALCGQLDEVLGGLSPDRPPGGDATAVQPRRAYLSGLSVRGFRGIGAEAKLPLDLGPGLTLVVGRNGTGKSSFAEAAELALTGTCSRWASKKAKVWQEGWQNLHASDIAPMITVDLAIDGESGTQTMVVKWPQGGGLDGAHWELRGAGAAADLGVESLGWTKPMHLYRPFLSYNELGSMLEEGPSHLYDALASVLGLESLSQAANDIAERRKELDKTAKATKSEVTRVVAALESLEDERSERARAALSGRRWNLDDVEALALGMDEEPGKLSLLARLGELTGPDLELANKGASGLRTAIAQQAELRGTDVDRAMQLASLLRDALDLHREHGDRDCPICGRSGVLDGDRLAEMETEIEQLESEAALARAAADQLKRAVGEAQSLLAPVPRVLAEAAEAGLDVGLEDARTAWLAWNDAPEGDPAALAEHLESKADPASSAIAALAALCVRRREELDDAWRPFAAQLGALLPEARQAQDAAETIKNLRSAEKWIETCAADQRDQRFEPVAQQVRSIWEALRQNSSVSIDEVVLSGTKTRRRVDVKVTVDDVESAALGVMSQGELHSLALSLFVPRATLPESPFGFLVIDDPVQAMDPARVEGLAHFLGQLGETRQVVVFTHDDRLPEALRRLRVPAKILEVLRRPDSTVEVGEASHPAQVYLSDARAVAKSDELPVALAAEVVPGLCRQALEAAAMDAARRQLFDQGLTHLEVERKLADQTRLLPRLALALFGDEERAGDVYGSLNNRWDRRSADTVRGCNEGTHGSELGRQDLVDLVASAQRLADNLIAL
jgi:recombinational DNA repair ATPase RecF